MPVAKLRLLTNIVEDIIQFLPPPKRIELLKNDSFITTCQSLMIVQEKPSLFNLFFDQFIHADNIEEKVLLLKSISLRKELLSDMQIETLVNVMEQYDHKELVDLSKKILTELLGSKPVSMDWEAWVKKSMNKDQNYQRLLDSSLSFKDRKIAYAKLCRTISKSEKCVFFDHQLLQNVLRIIYKNDDNHSLRNYLLLQLLGWGNDLSEGKLEENAILSKNIEKLLIDFMNNPDFYELYMESNPKLFANDEMKHRLLSLSDDSSASIICRAGAIWQLALNTRSRKALKQYAMRLIELFSKDFKKMPIIDFKKLDGSDSFICNLLVMMIDKDGTQSQFDKEKDLNFETISKAVSSMPGDTSESAEEKK
jgi:hypothetical protein